MAAMAWSMRVGRKVIYKVDGYPAYKLPDHHNQFGEAWWIDQDVTNFKCEFSAGSGSDNNSFSDQSMTIDDDMLDSVDG